MEVSPKSHPLSQLEFDVVVGADGRRNTLAGGTVLAWVLQNHRKCDELHVRSFTL